jgi:hypothetical protein
LQQIALKVLGGKYDPDKLRFPDSLLKSLPASPLHAAPASDLRDWKAIRAWANDLQRSLTLLCDQRVLDNPNSSSGGKPWKRSFRHSVV